MSLKGLKATKLRYKSSVLESEKSNYAGYETISKCEPLDIYCANAIVWPQDDSLTLTRDSQQLFNSLHL